MRVRLADITHIRLFATLLTAALALTAAGMSASPTVAAQNGIAYDEVTRVVRSDQPAPVPGGFSQDFQAAVEAQKNAGSTQHHGFLGAMLNAATMMKSALAVFKSGIPSTKYYYNGWERTDDPAKQTATILRPDRKQIIHLDLAKKTYHVDDMSTPIPQTPPPYQNPPDERGQQASPEPGTGKLDVYVSSSVLGPKTIDTYATTGYSQDFKMTSTQSTGSCHDGSVQMSMTEYVSTYAMPIAGPMSAMKVHMGTISPQTMAVHPGCNPTTTFHQHHSAGAKPPEGNLTLWTLATITGQTSTSQGPAAGGISTLIERGNVRVLGPGDAGLFDIPAGFMKE